MGKGNMFLGQARGKIGDVVYYMSKGISGQLFRVRRREIANPKTAKQLVQRAIMSTVMNAYKAGKVIFDHSFEGLSVPQGSMRAFQSRNLRALRAQLAEDFANADDAEYICRATLVGPKAVAPVQNEYIISEGTLEMKFFIYNGIQEGYPTWIMKAPTEGETFEAWKERVGLEKGDIFTFVCFAVDEVIDDEPQQFVFDYIRLTFTGEYNGEWGSENPAIGDLFDVEKTYYYETLSNRTLDENIRISEFSRHEGAAIGSIGLIMSKENSELRSTSKMYTSPSLQFELNARSVVEGWRANSSIDIESDLILEGGSV